MTLCAPVFFAEAIPNFRFPQKYLPPRPLLVTKSHISLVSALLSKLKPSLLACSAASSPETLLHAAWPRLSMQVIHTRPPSSFSFHIPHAPTAGATPYTQITAPPHQISAALSHGAHSIARIPRTIWQRRSKSRPHARMRS